MREPRRGREKLGRLLPWAGLLLMVVAGIGCTRKPQGAASAREAVTLFLARLAAKDCEGAAKLVAWAEMARDSNPDWDTFPSSQRQLILDKVRSENMSVLQALAAALAQDSSQPTPQPAGAPDLFLVQILGQPLLIQAVETDTGWLVLLRNWSL